MITRINCCLTCASGSGLPGYAQEDPTAALTTIEKTAKCVGLVVSMVCIWELGLLAARGRVVLRDPSTSGLPSPSTARQIGPAVWRLRERYHPDLRAYTTRAPGPARRAQANSQSSAAVEMACVRWPSGADLAGDASARCQLTCWARAPRADRCWPSAVTAEPFPDASFHPERCLSFRACEA